MRVMALFSTSFFAKYLQVGEDGPGRGHLCHTDTFLVYTVDSRYLDPSYLDPITYVELISKSRLFSLCIYCISASRLSNYFYVDTSAISSIIFSL